MDHLSAAGSSATRNLTTTEPSESLNRRKTVDFRFQRPHATSRSFFFNKPMRAMDSRRDFTSNKVFSGYFSELGEKANSALFSACAPTGRAGCSQGGKRELKNELCLRSICAAPGQLQRLVFGDNGRFFFVFAWGRCPKRPKTLYFPHYFCPESELSSPNTS